MRMKNKSGTMILTCLTAMVLMTSGMAFGATATLKTEKTVYLMDPYHWVYTAAQEVPGVWSADGNDRTVTFYVNTYDQDGDPADVAGINFDVYDDNDVLLVDGVALTPYPPGSPETGIYTGSFTLTEANVGAAGFSGQVPIEFSLEISDGGGLLKAHQVPIGRWGCDRCHVSQAQAQALYPWSAPAGGPLGPHTWRNILGGEAAPFTIEYLTVAENTHTPANLLNVHPFHEKTIRKLPYIDDCSPCHQGWGRVRYPWFGSSLPYLDHARAEAVECTFCHGIEGGYVPAAGTWKANAGYISETHMHNFVPLMPWSERDPYLANQSCSNSGCHGHIDDDAAGEVNQNKPNCRNCHGVHNDDF
jgi:hypothetical protein